MMPTYARISDLPTSGHCRCCGQDKPIAEMQVTRQRGKIMLLYRCRDCGNARRRGRHNSESKKEWRRRNPQSARDAVRKFKESHPEWHRRYTKLYWKRSAAAIRIVRRMEHRGIDCSVERGRQLLKKFGPAYPLQRGLTREGRLEVRRLQRRSGVSCWDATLIVYDDWADEPEAGYVLPAPEQKGSLPRGPGARNRASNPKQASRPVSSRPSGTIQSRLRAGKTPASLDAGGPSGATPVRIGPLAPAAAGPG